MRTGEAFRGDEGTQRREMTLAMKAEPREGAAHRLPGQLAA